jgi:hypothetical protein
VGGNLFGNVAENKILNRDAPGFLIIVGFGVYSRLYGLRRSSSFCHFGGEIFFWVFVRFNFLNLFTAMGGRGVPGRESRGYCDIDHGS